MNIIDFLSVFLIVGIVGLASYYFVVYFRKTEQFLACYSKTGDMSELKNTCTTYDNMNNAGRLIENNIGPIKDFHYCFTNNAIPELEWKTGLYTPGNIDAIVDKGMIQNNNDAVHNVYEKVNY